MKQTLRAEGVKLYIQYTQNMHTYIYIYLYLCIYLYIRQIHNIIRLHGAFTIFMSISV